MLVSGATWGGSFFRAPVPIKKSLFFCLWNEETAGKGNEASTVPSPQNLDSTVAHSVRTQSLERHLSILRQH